MFLIQGKVDCYNPIAAHRKSKFSLRIQEQQEIEFTNKKLAKILKKVVSF